MDNAEKTPIRSYLEWSNEGKSAIWRYVLAVILGFLIWLWGSVIPMLLVFRPLNIDPLTNPVAFYYTFIVGLVGIPLVVRLLLGRPAYSVALPSWPFNLADYGLGIVIQWAAMVIMYVLAAQVSYRGFEHIAFGAIVTVIAALIGVFIQTAFEEFFFRGLIAQATRRLTKWLPAVLGVQALFFASLHSGNIQAFGDSSWASVVYVTPALTWGWIAWRTGSLVLPAALHFANNTFIQLFVATEGDVVEGIAPFVAVLPAENPAFHTAIFVLGQSLITLIMVEVIFRRRAARLVLQKTRTTNGCNQEKKEELWI